MTAAAVVCLVHAALLLALAGFYGFELLRGEGSSPGTVIMSGLLILVFAALIATLARVWWVGSTRAAVPTFVWNGLLVPVVIALYGAGEGRLATGLLLALLAGVLTAVAAVVNSSPES
jgi:hypothetical protein